MATEISSDAFRNESPPPLGTSRGAAEDVQQVTREQAGALWNDAKETARAKLGDQQRSAASGLSDFAGALRKAAHEVGRDKEASAGHYAELAADGLERVAGTLRSKELNAMVHDVESFARRQPVAFIGAAIAVGFLAVRFLKASSRGPARSEHESVAGDARDHKLP
jgi:hypothetical protein